MTINFGNGVLCAVHTGRFVGDNYYTNLFHMLDDMSIRFVGWTCRRQIYWWIMWKPGM